MSEVHASQNKRRYSLKSLLKEENVRIEDHVDTWQNAIYLSLETLEKGGWVEARYAENIIKDTLELGPYYVLAEDVALIHARPEEGAVRQQLAVTVLKNPIHFSAGGFGVRILFALSAEDAHSHIEAIRLIASICMEEERIQEIIAAQSAHDVYELLMSYEVACE